VFPVYKIMCFWSLPFRSTCLDQSVDIWSRHEKWRFTLLTFYVLLLLFLSWIQIFTSVSCSAFSLKGNRTILY
jgi:hypothetical protein